jgi:hypothetical protein
MGECSVELLVHAAPPNQTGYESEKQSDTYKSARILLDTAMRPVNAAEHRAECHHGVLAAN